jgi:NTE family protein
MGQRPKLALALSGGGFTGYLFEIGALTALNDFLDDGVTINDFDLYVGVSAGAAAAALMANGVTPEEVFEANLSGERPYYFESRDIFAPATGEGLKTILRAAQRLVPLLRRYTRNRRDMSLIDLLDKAQDSLPSGVYTLEPFARYLEATFAAKGLSNAFDGLRKELYVPAIDLESGESVVFGDDGWRNVPISRAITASSAAPVYFCPVRIDGRDYLDAGIGRIAFFEVAIRRGARFLVIINPMICERPESVANETRPLNGHPVRLRDKGFLSIGDQASRINLEARFSQALKLFKHEHPDKECFVISPSSTETLLFERSFLSFRDRVHLLLCGYQTVAGLMTAQFERMQALFARNGLSTSLARIEDRMRRRLERVAKAGHEPAIERALSRRQTRWSPVL